MKTSVMEVHDMLSVLSVEEVENRIGKVPGVESVTVNYAAKNATVRYDETRIEIADIKSAVRQGGYESAASAPSAVSAGTGHEGHAAAAPATPKPTTSPATPAPAAPVAALPTTPKPSSAAPPVAPAGDEQKDKKPSHKS